MRIGIAFSMTELDLRNHPANRLHEISRYVGVRIFVHCDGAGRVGSKHQADSILFDDHGVELFLNSARHDDDFLSCPGLNLECCRLHRQSLPEAMIE